LKDVKVYDGAGWQSLKGPPGPSTVSADAGNLLATGSDRLLFYGGPERYEWEPYFVTDNFEVVTPDSASAQYYSAGVNEIGGSIAWNVLMVITIDKQALAGQGSLVGFVRIPIPYIETVAVLGGEACGPSVAEGSALVSDQVLSAHFEEGFLYLRMPNTDDGSNAGILDWSKIKTGTLRVSAIVR
jgi:hypothetical protein